MDGPCIEITTKRYEKKERVSRSNYCYSEQGNLKGTEQGNANTNKPIDNIALLNYTDSAYTRGVTTQWYFVCQVSFRPLSEML